MVAGKEPETLYDVLLHRLKTDADGPYLEFDGKEYSARQIDEEAGRLAHALSRLGVGHGDRVGTLMDNCPEQVVSFFAALKLEAIQVPINPAYKGEFLRHQLSDAGIKALLVQGDLAARVQLVAGAEATPELEAAIVVGEPDVAITAVPQLNYTEILRGASPGGIPAPKLEPSDIACFIYTSGTTGPSKGCMLPHKYVLTMAKRLVNSTERRADDIVLTPLPLFHLYALSYGVIGTLLVGGKACIGRRFSVSKFWPEVKRTNATIISILGSLAMLIANSDDHEDRAGHKLRMCMAVPMPPDTDRIWRERFGCKTFSGAYGLTEASVIGYLPAGEEMKPGATGKPNNNEFEVRIVDEKDNELPLGEVGEIVCRPRRPNVMFTGYFRRPEATLNTFRNLWFHTGDLGRIDEDDYLFFVDRKKDYMRRRGENISSVELEKTFFQHEKIKDVAVHSVLSELSEDDVKATVVLKDGIRITEEELCAWAAERLPYFAMPRFIEFRDDLPRTPTGRVQKYLLRDEGKTPNTWDREAAGFVIERR